MNTKEKQSCAYLFFLGYVCPFTFRKEKLLFKSEFEKGNIFQLTYNY